MFGLLPHTTFNKKYFKQFYLNIGFFLLLTLFVKNFVLSKPSIIFCKSRSFRDSLTASHFDSLEGPKSTSGTYPCGSCAYCTNLDKRSSVTLPDGTTWTSHHYVNCTSRGIVYLLNCPSGAFYVGITRREYHKSIHDHVYATSIGYYKFSIGKHIALAHNYASVHLTFVTLVHIPPNPRGGDWKQTLLQAEARWIFRLKALTPPGLNESLGYKPFL